MFVQPWDAAIDTDEWRNWLATSGHFGVLAVNNLDPAQAPLVIPTHFTAVSADEILLHLARPNPVWPHLEAAAQVRISVMGDYAYVPGYWRAADDVPPEDGVPTSYYAAVQFVCTPTIVDDPHAKAGLTQQLDGFQPEGRHAEVDPDQPPYGRMLPGIRGIRLEVLHVDAKFKYDDHKPVQLREKAIDNLLARGRGLDASAAAQQQRRLRAVGDWKANRTTENPNEQPGGSDRADM
ncbi:MAG: FMN-binding negative transcriptional regulator [Cellulomonas sp.]|uniref:FMN-binding negative transcriptional regulator n=1 Tax=Cellulomonas sp. 73-92 TaxID=1895740 RepID=UPI00092A7459|nr:FMN-binding negative transcriptional regulator [Cellulomonas sp. 73-92]MBN9374914.1 FMN-binding negative transcriptional regulator [Cellulomonas sp.]OJV83366.1 MAG: transcriptional regulator [Cellulomonas sp. 73-92]